MRTALLLALAAVVSATCRRVEEPEPVPTTGAEPPAERPAPTTPLPDAAASATSGTAASAEESAKAPDPGRCVAPLVEPPPPTATKAASCPHDPVATPPVLTRGRIAFPEANGAPTLSVEIADSPAEEQRGLMYRTSLGAERGMIFVWKDESIRTFWMHNTCIPLDMLFLALDGTVVGILEQVPVLNEAPRAVHCPAGYVLEVNAGWSRRHGVKPGIKAHLEL